MYKSTIKVLLSIYLLLNSVSIYTDVLPDYDVFDIGATIQVDDPWPKVTEIIPGSPAAEAGIMVGDEVMAINEWTWESFADLPGSYMFARGLHGEENTLVTLIILRGSKKRTISAKRLINVRKHREHRIEQERILRIKEEQENAERQKQKLEQQQRCRTKPFDKRYYYIGSSSGVVFRHVDKSPMVIVEKECQQQDKDKK